MLKKLNIDYTMILRCLSYIKKVQVGNDQVKIPSPNTEVGKKLH